MAKSATLAFGFPPIAIAGSGFTLVLTVTNGDGSNTNVVSLQPFAYLPGPGGNAPNVKFGPIANTNTIANNTGAAITIANNSSMTFTFEAVIDAPSMPTMTNQGGALYYLAVNCQTSDGSVFITPPLAVTLNTDIALQPNGQVQIIGSTTWAYALGETAAGLIPFGATQFNKGQHSYYIPFYG